MTHYSDLSIVSFVHTICCISITVHPHLSGADAGFEKGGGDIVATPTFGRPPYPMVTSPVQYWIHGELRYINYTMLEQYFL